MTLRCVGRSSTAGSVDPSTGRSYSPLRCQGAEDALTSVDYGKSWFWIADVVRLQTGLHGPA
jgi:hypothetical protein